MFELRRCTIFAVCSAALLLAAITARLPAQSTETSVIHPEALPPTTPLPTIKFDVISFRRTQQYGSQRVDLPDDGDSIAYHGQPMSRILYFAFYYAGDKLAGEPGWVDSDLYEFRAKVAPEDVPAWKAMTLQTKRLMVKQLLEDTCNLKFHLNDRQESVYELVVAPGGPKLTAHVEGESKKFPDGTVVEGTNTHWTSPVEAYFQRNTMANLASALTAHNTAGRPVIDKTGVTGRYDFTLPVPYGQLPPEMMDQLNPASIFSELQKLGLKLVSGKVAMPGIVLDHIERPPED